MASTTGNVELTILDGGGAVVVPGSSVQAVIGTSSAGTVAQPLAFKNVNALVAAFGYGPGVEAAALAIAAGGTVIFTKATSATPGAATAVTSTAFGTSVLTVTGTPLDTYLVRVNVIKAGTVGTTGSQIQISLDGGKNYGPVLSIGTATTYVIANTGLTLNFAAGTLLAGGYALFSTTEPLWNTAGIQACIAALQASPFASTGWGSMHIVGPMSGANASTIQGYLDTLATQYIYTRALVSARDLLIPTAWGGAGETEATWTTAVLADYAAVNAKRIDAHAGYYNLPSAIANPSGGAPRYRRPLAWAAAARQVTLPPQRHAGRVKDGSLSQIVVDSTLDPTDGFVYHDERVNPNFDGNRFTSARTRIGLPGYFIANPQLMSQLGSVFTLLPLGLVMDVACGICNTVGQQDINSDVRLNNNGTIYENDAKFIESKMLQALRENMVANQQLSDARVVVDRTNNVRTTNVVNVGVTIYSRGYVLQENVTIGYSTSGLAGS